MQLLTDKRVDTLSNVVLLIMFDSHTTSRL
jgi:hypothetical protein